VDEVDANMKAVLPIALMLILATGAVAAELTIAEDRMAVVDGERTFILGLYENPKDDADLARAAEAGFNLVRASSSAESLDRLHAQGLYAWLTTGYAIDLSDQREQREARLKSMVDSFIDHPALIVWEVLDEALWNCWYSAVNWRRGNEPKQQSERIEALEDAALRTRLEAMMDEVGERWERGDFTGSEELADDIWRQLGETPPKEGLSVTDSPARVNKMAQGFLDGYRVLSQLDQRHPIWMNHAPRNQMRDLQLFTRASDIVGCDIYPVAWGHNGHSDLAEQSIAAAGAYTRIMQQAGPGKPVWMVLQGFGWADLDPDADEQQIADQRRPTLSESRFMAYDAIVRGARGILYWGTAYIEKDSQLWEDLLKLGAELHGLQPVLSAPDADLDITVTIGPHWGSLDRTVHILPKQVGEVTWLIVVNESREPLDYTLTSMDALDGTRYRDVTADRQATVKDGKLELTIRAQGVQVLAPE
jgi:hypothetical protein